MKSNFKKTLKQDLENLYGSKEKKICIEYVKNRNFKLIFWLRLCQSTKNKILKKIYKVILNHYEIKLNIEIPSNVKIGPGLAIHHFGGIIINNGATIGNDLDIRQGVTIGNNAKGCPIIGNNVYIGAGAKIIGNVLIGNNVTIGANAVVTKDIPDNSVCVGVPAKVIKEYKKKILIIVRKINSENNIKKYLEKQKYFNVEIKIFNPFKDDLSNLVAEVDSEYILFIDSNYKLNEECIGYIYSICERDYTDGMIMDIETKCMKIKNTFSKEQVKIFLEKENNKILNNINGKFIKKDLLKNIILEYDDNSVFEKIIERSNVFSINTCKKLLYF